MAEKDLVVFLDVKRNSVQSVHGDGSAHKTLFTRHCVGPDGLALDLSTFHISKNPSDMIVWWSNMGAMKPMPSEKDGGDWHTADGYPVRALLHGGDAAAEAVPVKRAEHLYCGDARTELPPTQPLITTMKQVALSDDGRSLFFCDREGHCVKKYNIDTAEVVPLLSTDALAALQGGQGEVAEPQPAPNSDGDKSRMCVGITLDEPRNHLFFTVKGPSKGGKGSIHAVPYRFTTRNVSSAAAASAPTAEGVIDPHTVVTLRSHLPEPIDLLLDAEKDFLYWTDRGDEAMGGNTLNRATISYKPNGQPQLGGTEVLLSGFTEAIGLDWPAAHVSSEVAEAQGLRRYMYVTDRGHLWRCDMQARTKEAIYVCPPDGMLTGIVAVRVD